jgi:5-methyltetrahydrofolate--homocysteine methyltransferase
MGTMLQQAGLPAGMPPEVWLLENPDSVQGVHRAYRDAGSDLILSCTFGGTRARLEHHGFANRVAEVNQRAVEIARQAAGARAYVAGDIGPLGQFLMPIGTLSYAEAVDIFAEQVEALAAAGVDVLYIETMADLEEMRAAIEGAQRAGQGLPIFGTFSFDHNGWTNMGVSPQRAAELFLEMDVDAFGANCGTSLEMTEGAVAEMHDTAPDAALIVKPNAGKPRLVDDEVLYDAQPADMAAYARRFVELGARVVGGCCGSTPAHIEAIAQAVRG